MVKRLFAARYAAAKAQQKGAARDFMLHLMLRGKYLIWLLGGLRQLRRGLQDVLTDMSLELLEILAEHGDQLAGLGVIGSLVGPGVAGIENLGVHPRNRDRNPELEVRV